MTQEEFQELVLEKLVSLVTGQKSLESKQGILESGLSEIKQEINELKEFQKSSLYETVQYINNKTDRIENKLDVLNDELFIQKAAIKGLTRVK